MGSNLNFSNFGNQPSGDGGGSNGGGGNRSPGNFPLARQTSVYSLTFDEFQSSLGKDFGSMNMDELLRNIWSAEETQGVAPPTVAGGSSATGAGVGGLEGLQRQGSLTLPRTLSQRTVDEVWKDLAKEYTLVKNVINSGEGSNMPQTQRQQTLGEMTLEEFLVRAGVVREETQLAGKVNNGGFLGNNNNGNTGLVIGFQQPSPKVSTLTGNRGPDSLNQISIQSSHSPMDVNGGRSSNQQPIFPKQPNFSYGTQMSLQGTNAQLGSPRMRNGIVETGDQGLVQSSMLPVGSLGLACSVATQSPMAPFSPDEIGRNNGDVASVSPVPYMFGGVVRGRKRSGAVEKVVERRQKRMIKNRESAARSRARKQAYTTELEAEVAKLKEENEELQRIQAEIMKLQKNQVMEMMNATGGPKKRLRRTQTGPW